VPAGHSWDRQNTGVASHTPHVLSHEPRIHDALHMDQLLYDSHENVIHAGRTSEHDAVGWQHCASEQTPFAHWMVAKLSSGWPPFVHTCAEHHRGGAGAGAGQERKAQPIAASRLTYVPSAH
jgi:hypothetical protein